jgi:tRNA-specific 2-thiouridylase
MKVAVGLSGGVDSSVAALLLKRAGHEVTGVTMKLWRGTFRGGARDACFGPGEADDIERAAEFARSIGVDYSVLDCSEAYEREIVDAFREISLRGETPNPCVLCNASLKFGLLPRLARAQGVEFDCFATGHYARIVRTGGRFAVRRAADEKKDQSYFLYRLSQEQLAHTLFPLGEHTKEEVRAFARAHGLGMADKPDSQDFYSGDRNELLGVADREGEVVDLAGRVLGRHRGYWHYTIGQRKGLGIAAPEPLYVVRVDACHNRVVLGGKDALCVRSFRVDEMNWMAQAETDAPLACGVKIRSTGAPRGPTTFQGGVCTVPDGIAGVAPGQSAVFYGADGEILCGGVIQ